MSYAIYIYLIVIVKLRRKLLWHFGPKSLHLTVWIVRQTGAAVSSLPDLEQENARMEAVEDKERQGDARDDTPGQHTEVSQLQLLAEPALADKRVKRPQRNVAAQ